MADSKQINRLLSIKTMRRKLAELDAARANARVSGAMAALSNARQDEQDIIITGDQRRENRISELVNTPSNVPLQDTMIVNTFARTDFERDQARANVLQKTANLGEARVAAAEKQQKLARFLQVEERAKQLCSRLEASEALEAQRCE